PGTDTVRVEDLVPGRIQRVGGVDAATVAADLDHLRAPCEAQLRVGRVRCPPDDPAQVHGTGLFRVVRVADVVLLELAGSPAGDVEPAVVDREVDVADE